MVKYSIIFVLFLMSFSTKQPAVFKEQQLTNPRVQKAFSEKRNGIVAMLKHQDIDTHSFDVFIRSFKFEEDLELWAKSKDTDSFQLIKKYKFCKSVGLLGPKRKEGDKQIPEGVYHISNFNPVSTYYLSLKLNYPNKSERILSHKQSPGGQIYIHGGCETIGCIPITNEGIKELYVFCVLAKNGGQTNIPIHSFPARLTDENFELLKNQYSDKEMLSFWSQLKNGFQLFEKTKKLPNVKINNQGEYHFY